MTPPDLEDEDSEAPSDDERSRIILGNQNRDFTPAPLPVGPDGGPAATPGYVDPIEPDVPTEENCICLRGPCRFYMRWKNTMDVGNSKGVFEEGKVPREEWRFCTAMPGDPIDMGPSLVSECNRWDPEDDSEPQFAMRDRRRAIYAEHHPEQRPETFPDVPGPDDAAPVDPTAPDDTKPITKEQPL